MHFIINKEKLNVFNKQIYINWFIEIKLHCFIYCILTKIVCLYHA